MPGPWYQAGEHYLSSPFPRTPPSGPTCPCTRPLLLLPLPPTSAQAPQLEAKEIAYRRFPAPKIVDCDQNGSQVSAHGRVGALPPHLTSRPTHHSHAPPNLLLPAPAAAAAPPQARYLLAKLNPSSTYSSTNPLSAEVINTDDVSLSTFTEHLKRLAVQS